MNTFLIKTKIYSGKQSLQSYLFTVKSKKVIIITDAMMVKLGMIEPVERILKERNISYCIYDDILPDPDTGTVINGIKVMREVNPDMMLAIGGGSVIDTGKAILLTLCDMADWPKPLFVVVPTTSGTGSEVTTFSVIKDNQSKLVLVDELIAPDVAVLDPSLVLSVPAKITADTGLDVLTHCIEAYVSNLANDFTDALAEKGIALVFSYLLRCYQDGQDYEAREKMHNASCIAGMAFTNASLGINHSLAHALGGKFGIPHGRTNAILLPYVIAFNADLFGDCNTQTAEKYARISQKILECSNDSAKSSVISLIKILNYYRKQLGIPHSFSEYGIDKYEFEQSLDYLAQTALDDVCTKSNPRMVNLSYLKEIYTHAFNGYQF